MRGVTAILSGVASAVLAAVVVAWTWGGLHGAGGVVALVVGLATALAVFAITPASPGRRPSSFWDWLMIALFTLASARVFFWLIYADGDSWKVLSPNNLGDLSLHISFIRWFAATTHWWPVSPILAGDPLRYPPGSDLFNALLLTGGVPVPQGLICCGVVGAALAGYALWLWGGAVALAAFLFNGGVAGFLVLKTGWGGDPDAQIEWKNFFLTLYVTQRGFLFALPAGLLLLAAWRGETFGAGSPKVLPLPVQALLLGIMPLFSIHAALFLGVAMLGLFLLSSASRKRMLRLALLAWPSMAFLGWLVTSGGGGPSAVHSLGWAPGWMTDGSVWFWFRNFGIALPLTFLLCVLLLRGGGGRGAAEIAEARAFVLPAAFVFALCMVVRFAPWPWDNMKLMLWSWLVAAPYLWSFLLKRWHPALRTAALLLMFGSGAVTLAVGLDGRHGYELIKRSDLDQATWILRGLAPDAVIACAPEYNHPVLLAGHPVVCGYEGHLWSHGLDYKDRLATLDAVMKGEAGWKEKARGLGASHIYWSDLESKRWPDSKLPWAKETGTALYPLE